MIKLLSTSSVVLKSLVKTYLINKVLLTLLLEDNTF